MKTEYKIIKEHHCMILMDTEKTKGQFSISDRMGNRLVHKTFDDGKSADEYVDEFKGLFYAK